jgi:hypothetical protein
MSGCEVMIAKFDGGVGNIVDKQIHCAVLYLSFQFFVFRTIIPEGGVSTFSTSLTKNALGEVYLMMGKLDKAEENLRYAINM